MREYADIHASSARPTGLLVELWRFRELLGHLVLRDLKVKYQRSIFGFVWTLLNPLVTITILAAVFSVVVRIPVPAYWAFLLSGYFVWNFFSQCIGTSTYILAQHAGLRRSVAYPNEVMLLSATASRFFEFLVEMLLVVVIISIGHHGGVPQSLILLPVLFAIQILLSIGLMLPVATISVFYQDVQHMVPGVLLMLFYLSPVFYPVEMVPEAAREVFLLNPLAWLLTLYHTVLYEGGFPPIGMVGGMAAFAVIIFAIGYVIFRRHQLTFAEIA